MRPSRHAALRVSPSSLLSGYVVTTLGPGHGRDLETVARELFDCAVDRGGLEGVDPEADSSGLAEGAETALYQVQRQYLLQSFDEQRRHSAFYEIHEITHFATAKEINRSIND